MSKLRDIVKVHHSLRGNNMLKINKKCDLYTYYFICQHHWWGLYVVHLPALPVNHRTILTYCIEGQGGAESIT